MQGESLKLWTAKFTLRNEKHHHIVWWTTYLDITNCLGAITSVRRTALQWLYIYSSNSVRRTRLARKITQKRRKLLRSNNANVDTGVHSCLLNASLRHKTKYTWTSPVGSLCVEIATPSLGYTATSRAGLESEGVMCGPFQPRGLGSSDPQQLQAWRQKPSVTNITLLSCFDQFCAVFIYIFLKFLTNYSVFMAKTVEQN